MIKQLKINAFKSVKKLEIECAGLNLFVGVNSSGKSTCLQALLLFEQNRKKAVGLNGEYISLGEFREVRNNYMPRVPISIEVDHAEESGREVCESIIFEENDTGYRTDRTNMHSEEAKDREFYYLSCHRIGARDIYQKNLERHSMFGNDGEYGLFAGTR